ncbi:DUF3152 domain-containing protein [Actinoplanes sp. TBRC 11911]|uniref:DUF3152 domain-containing protein n=1 Tax=Actinoplanes sp. TBRC 11911 TaxID=2729386 RepID=UPI00145D9B32|nr:DUF3152 domain-containing protein [Actinoplanes sp. TBRC 11911]NMO54929.1 DUF3152 domain-containing protein [Actinoplanes sp. TBRC 11911]
MATIRPRAATSPRRSASAASAYPRRAMIVMLLMIALLAAGEVVHTDPKLQSRSEVTPQDPTPSPVRVAAAPVLPIGPGTSGRFAYAPGYGPVLGTAGKIRRYRVAVELPASGSLAAGFAYEVDRVLGDPRGWIAARDVRLRRVPHTAYAEFTIFLASAGTSRRMCSQGGLDTGGYTSCRLPGRVIINGARWHGAVAGYGAPLGTYRAYAVNHEVGHQLGHGHEGCPGRGRPAPVMMQQTYGLEGCTPNPWPYLKGRRYAGPPVG